MARADVPPVTGKGEYELVTIKKRKDFQAASSGLRFSAPAFTLLRRIRLNEAVPLCENQLDEVPPDLLKANLPFRFGFTVTKKLGNAVIRNRIRRRLKAAVYDAVKSSLASPDRHINPHDFQVDFVVLARKTALNHPYKMLVEDFARGIIRLCEAAADAKPPIKPPAKSR